MSEQKWFGIPVVVDPALPPDSFRFEVDPDIRCTHRDAVGQCLDSQGHAGDHQPPTAAHSDAHPESEQDHASRARGTQMGVSASQCASECYGAECDLPEGHTGDHRMTWPNSTEETADA